MTQTHAQRITYQGTPTQAHALGQMLEEEGVNVLSQVVSQAGPREVADVVSSFVVLGPTAAVNLAVSSLRKRFPNGGTVTSEPDENNG